MKLLLLADSHNHTGHIRALAKALRKSEAPDALLFAGDGVHDPVLLGLSCPHYLVRGNCDFSGNYPDEMVLPPLAGHRIYLSHGHLHRVKRTTDLLAAAARAAEARIAVYGHTHRQGLDLVEGVYCVNPGSLGNGEYALLLLEPGKMEVKFQTLPK